MDYQSKKRCIICACAVLVLLIIATAVLLASIGRSTGTKDSVPAHYIGIPL